MKKILFSDLDGTLVGHNKELHPKNFELIKQLRRQGHLVAICTGRTIIDIQPTLKHMPFEYDYLVLCNGGHIVDRKGNVIYEKTISKEIGNQIINQFSKDPTLITYFCDEKVEISLNEGKVHQVTEDGFEEVQLDFFEEAKKADRYYILGYNQVDEGIEKLEIIKDEVYKKYHNDVEVYFNTHFIDIVPKGCSKGNGVKELVKALPFPVEVYAIGDSYNDLSMIEVADHGFTFHRAAIKDKTECVDYVYEVIEKML